LLRIGDYCIFNSAHESQLTTCRKVNSHKTRALFVNGFFKVRPVKGFKNKLTPKIN